MEDQVDEDGFTADNDMNLVVSRKEVEWRFGYLHDSSHRDTPALPAIRDLYTRFDVNKLSCLIDPQAIIKDWISFIPMVVELPDQLAETKNMSLAHSKEHHPEVARLHGLIF